MKITQLLKLFMVVTIIFLFNPVSSYALLDTSFYSGYFKGEIKSGLEKDEETNKPKVNSLSGGTYGMTAHINGGIGGYVNIGLGGYYQKDVFHKVYEDKEDIDVNIETYGFDSYIRLIFSSILQPYARFGLPYKQNITIGNTSTVKTFNGYYYGFGLCFSVAWFGFNDDEPQRYNNGRSSSRRSRSRSSRDRYRKSSGPTGVSARFFVEWVRTETLIDAYEVNMDEKIKGHSVNVGLQLSLTLFGY